jgi:glucosamine-6-phosphate deaminase
MVEAKVETKRTPEKIFLKFPNREEASEFIAKIFYTTYTKFVNPLFGTATGQTPVKVYEYFIEKMKDIQGSEKDLVFRQLDNYISPGSSEGNLPFYSYQVELENSVWKIPHKEAHIPFEWAKPEEEVERYKKIISETNEWKGFFIQLLGIGDKDGHIAFNMPGDSFDSTVHIVDLNQETIEANANKFFGGDTTKVPKQAITSGIADILKADAIILAGFGKAKADIMYRTFYEEATTDVPASALQEYDGTLFVILDEDSASTIIEKEGEYAFNTLGDLDIFDLLVEK